MRYRAEEGHVQLWRRIAGLPKKNKPPHRWWPTEEKRAFTRLEAWVDLLFRAAFKPHTRYFKGRKVQLRQGELVTSERDLSERWRWSRTKVRAYLEDAVENAEIDHWTNQHVTFIRVRKMAGLADYDVEQKTTPRTDERTTIEVPPSSTPPVIERKAPRKRVINSKLSTFVDNILKRWEKR